MAGASYLHTSILPRRPRAASPAENGVVIPEKKRRSPDHRASLNEEPYMIATGQLPVRSAEEKSKKNRGLEAKPRLSAQYLDRDSDPSKAQTTPQRTRIGHGGRP